ncbi:MAG: glycosyltransferase family 2 protein [Gallionella sp.]
MARISIIIITKNEAANIRACLESVKWADEIIVVDSGSSDATVEICKEFGAQVHVTDWPGFGAQKNRALSYATNDWVFSIDADERMTAELRTEIERSIREGNAQGYFCPRLSQFCGKFIHHSGWYPDYVLRLFKRDSGRFSDHLVHESVLVNGATVKLKNPLLHYSYLTEADVQRKIEQYSMAAAKQMYQSGKRATPFDAPLRSAWAFIRTYLLRQGFMDGVAGWRIARMNAATTFLKYQRLRQLLSTQAPL